MLYVPRGPVLDYDDFDLIPQILASLETYARRHKALFIKIDPAVALGSEPDDASLDPQGQALQTNLLKRGWRYADQQIQFKNTVILDLAPAEDDLLAAMKPKWRYNIRLAGRKGVVVESGGLDDLPAFFQLYAETAQRDNFLIRPRAYYLDAWQSYLTAEPKQADLLLARYEGQPIAGLLLLYFGRTAWYMYGASADQGRNLMPNHLLQWQAIKAARAAGATRYDMWGAPDDFAETDTMWGVYRFKMGFGGVTRRGLGAYDFPVQPLTYRLYNQLLPRLLSLLRARSQPQSQ
jgi:lipid II:glycine glycyltransferase (peptidoglycan interpeptide bridge formation enzyme)